MALSAADAAKLQQQLQEIERLSRLLGANINTINLQPIEANAGAIEAIFQRLTNQAAGLGEETDYLVSNFQKLIGEIKKTSAGVSETSKGLRNLSSITEQISSHQKGYNDLSSKEIAKLKDKVQIETDRLKIAKDTLREEAQNVRQKIANNNLQGRALQIELDKLAKINIARRNTLNLLRNEDITLGELNNQLKIAEDSAIHMEKTLGLTGAALKGISKIPILGDIVDTNAALQAAKDNIKEGGNRVSAMKASFKNMGGQIKANLSDPLVRVGFFVTQMVAAIKEGDEATGNLAKDFNITYNEANRVREQLTMMANLSGELAVNTKGLQESMVAVGKALGTNAMLNEKDLVFMTKMREMAGFTNEELIGMERTTLATGGNLEENTKNLMFAAKTTGLNNKVLLNEKDIMRDVAKASDAIKLSLAGNPEALGKAAAQAKAFGMNLEQVDRIAGGLLDFESSISAELEAQLLTGKNINLDQARLYAINNDIEGLSRELAKNFGTVAEFSKMNRLQQDAAAKAVGMTREELAATLTDKEALANISAKDVDKAKEALAAARAKGMSEEEIARQGIDNLMKQQSMQERMNNAVDKLKELFVGIAETLSPILDLLTGIFEIAAFIMKPIGALMSWADSFGPVMKTIVGLLVAAGAAALFLNGSLTFGIGVAVALTAIGVGMSALKSATSVKDAMISPDGGLMVSGEKGTFSLDKNDTVIAGTNLNKSQGGGNQQNLNNDAAVRELQEIKSILRKTLDVSIETARGVAASGVGSAIAMALDTDKFGTIINTNTYKTQ